MQINASVLPILISRATIKGGRHITYGPIERQTSSCIVAAYYRSRVRSRVISCDQAIANVVIVVVRFDRPEVQM
jgi:hypothetical protein